MFFAFAFKSTYTARLRGKLLGIEQNLRGTRKHFRCGSGAILEKKFGEIIGTITRVRFPSPAPLCEGLFQAVMRSVTSSSTGLHER